MSFPFWRRAVLSPPAHVNRRPHRSTDPQTFSASAQSHLAANPQLANDSTHLGAAETQPELQKLSLRSQATLRGSRFFHIKIGRSEGRAKILGARAAARGRDRGVARRRRGESKKFSASDLSIFCEKISEVLGTSDQNGSSPRRAGRCD